MASTVDKIDSLLNLLNDTDTNSESKSCETENAPQVADVDGKGKIIVITGVSSGIGNALVHSFIEKGCIVLGCARRKQLIDKLNKENPNKDNTNVPYFTCVDITNAEAVQSLEE